MLTYLEDGYGIYLIIAICGIGVLSKLVANIIYSSLVKQSENMVSAKDKCLKQLRLKFENTYKMNMDIRNVQVFIEKNLSKYRFCGLSLKRWDNINRQNAVFCLLLGLVFTFYSYWSQGDTDIVLLQLATGIIMCVFGIFFETIADTATKQEVLLVNLRDYFENTLIYRAAMEASESLREANAVNGISSNMQDDIFMKKKQESKNVSAFMNFKKNREDDNLSAGLNIIRNSKMRERDKAVAELKKNAKASPNILSEKNNSLNYKSSGENEGLNYKFKKPESQEEKSQINPEYASDIETLKKSLAQLAAAREDNVLRSNKEKKTELSQEEEKIIEDIIKEYLA